MSRFTWKLFDYQMYSYRKLSSLKGDYMSASDKLILNIRKSYNLSAQLEAFFVHENFLISLKLIYKNHLLESFLFQIFLKETLNDFFCLLFIPLCIDHVNCILTTDGCYGKMQQIYINFEADELQQWINFILLLWKLLLH